MSHPFLQSQQYFLKKNVNNCSSLISNIYNSMALFLIKLLSALFGPYSILK